MAQFKKTLSNKIKLKKWFQSDGDTASVFGIGFPPFWGGPFRFVDMYGADKLIGNMLRYAEAYSSEQFKPAQIIQDHAKQNTKFYSE